MVDCHPYFVSWPVILIFVSNYLYMWNVNENTCTKICSGGIRWTAIWNKLDVHSSWGTVWLDIHSCCRVFEIPQDFRPLEVLPDTLQGMITWTFRFEICDASVWKKIQYSLPKKSQKNIFIFKIRDSTQSTRLRAWLHESVGTADWAIWISEISERLLNVTKINFVITWPPRHIG